jgi:type I restriction enzyme M protein
MALTKEEAEKSNLPDLVTRWGERNGAERHRLRTAQSFCLSKIGIEAAGYDFSLNRYKEIEHGHAVYESPAEILADLRLIEARRWWGDLSPRSIGRVHKDRKWRNALND